MVREQICVVRSQNGPKQVTNDYLVWSRTFITHVNTGNIVVWETQHNNADKDCCKILILQETLKARSRHLEEFCAFSEAENIRTKKLDLQETDFSFSQFHRSWGNFSRCRFTHGWDPRSRSSGFSDWSISFLTEPNLQKPKMQESQGETHKRKQIPTTNTNLDLINICHVPSNRTHSGSNAVLFVFEDDETVNKMIIKGRSPTMRHVSRSHRVALDWLFDRINLDSKIQIRNTDIKHQFADILTKGNFTRDERNNLLHLLNISHFSSTCCAKNSSLIRCTKKMAKRVCRNRKMMW